MKSELTDSFRKRFKRLPPHIQKQARAAYLLWKVNPYYPGLQFKRIDPEEPIYSVRIGLHYRAVGGKCPTKWTDLARKRWKLPLILDIGTNFPGKTACGQVYYLSNL